MHAERGNYQWPPCPACRCVACSWSCAGSVVTQSSLVTPSPHAHLRWAIHRWCGSCMAPDLSADHFQRGWKTPDVDIGFESVCNRQYCGQTVNWGSRSWTSSVHSQRSTVAHKLFLKTSACGQAASEERL